MFNQLSVGRKAYERAKVIENGGKLCYQRYSRCLMFLRNAHFQVLRYAHSMVALSLGPLTILPIRQQLRYLLERDRLRHVDVNSRVICL